MPNSSIRQLSEQELLRVDLPETLYKVDMALFGHGQNLSAELLKLSLAGIAVVGALLTIPTRPWPDDLLFRLLLSFSVVVFAFSTSLALLQRFFASSAMFHHIKAMKVAHSSDVTLAESVDVEIAIRLNQFTRAHKLLVGTAFFLALGAVSLGSAFVRLLFIP